MGGSTTKYRFDLPTLDESKLRKNSWSIGITTLAACGRHFFRHGTHSQHAGHRPRLGWLVGDDFLCMIYGYLYRWCIMSKRSKIHKLEGDVPFLLNALWERYPFDDFLGLIKRYYSTHVIHTWMLHGSMYGIFTIYHMYPKTYPTVGKYSLHEAYGCICDTSEEKHSRKRTKKQNVQLSKLCCHLAQSFIPGIRLWPCIRSNLTNQFPHSEWNRLYFNQLGCSNAAMALSELTEKVANDYKWLHL